MFGKFVHQRIRQVGMLLINQF